MTRKFSKSKIEEISRQAIRRIKRKFKPIAIVQFGSSLDPKRMMIESDVDFIAVTAKRPKKRVEVFSFDSIEAAFKLLPKRDFIKGVKNGSPVTIMAIKFGKIRYDPHKFLEKCRKFARPTENTSKTWYENGWAIYSRAVLEYFSRSCVGCYLKDCHHSARSFLRAFILKEKGILCEKDEEIIYNSPKNLKAYYQKLIGYRKEGERFPFKLFPKLIASTVFRDFEARPLLALEKLLNLLRKN